MQDGPAPLTSMKPSYDPAAGRLPDSETVISLLPPACSATVVSLNVTCAVVESKIVRTASVNVTLALLTLVSVRLRFTGSAVTGPNEMAAGSSVAATATASTALSLPAPASVTCTVPCKSPEAVLTTADFKRPGVFRFGFFAFAMAATPAANGTA